MKIKNIFIKKNFLIALLPLLLLGIILFSQNNLVLAQQSESDAIAVRIIPNPNHLSAQRWYQSQGFSGSPQSLIVDGYKAVRDGRTVYVSATNVVGNNLYTNIYLISYDQGADSQTVDIFGRILNNWKFNINLNANIGTCSISDKNCYTDSDCGQGYVCGNLNDSQQNKCVLEDAPSCLIDSDCPNDLFCNSLKSKIIRDVDRLEKILVLKEKISQYNQNNNKYPTLDAGTYLPHVALSTWPSWQNVFLGQIGVSGIIDPINKLGSCADEEQKFNLNTCWNATDNIFYNANNYSNFVLPASSYVIAYIANPNGSDYELCAVMETALDGINYSLASSTLEGFSCSLDSTTGNIGLSGQNTNNAPYVSEYSLEGEAGQEFSGFIKAVDPEGHPISWGIESTYMVFLEDNTSEFKNKFVFIKGLLNNIIRKALAAALHNTDFSTWTPPQKPSILNTGNPLQKNLWAESAGAPGVYPVTINLSDNAGSSSSEILYINIATSAPQIIAGDINYNANYGTPFLGEIIINSKNQLVSGSVKIATNNLFLNLGLNAQATLSENNCTALAPSSGGLEACLEKLSDQEYLVKIRENSSGLNTSVFAPGSYPYKIKVDTQYGSSFKDFSINITADAPVLNLNNCLTVANLGDYYECNLSVFGSNEGVSFSIGSSLPQGLSYDSVNKKIKGYLLEMVNDYPITVSAQNNLGMSSSKTFSLNITSNCGNYLVQYPGGPWNSNGTIRNQGGYYRTVLIGNQCWLKDNLNIGNMILSTSTPANNTTFEKFCQNNDSMNCSLFGGLYKWNEAMDYFYESSSFQGVCPDGWRVPTDNEWYILENYLKNDGQACEASRDGGALSCLDAGDKLKTTVSNFSPPWSGSNSSGFSALFNPLMYSSGEFFNPDSTNVQWTSYWSSTSNTSDNSRAIARLLNSNSSGVQRASKTKQEAHSIRCIKEVKQCNINSDCNYLGTGYNCSNGFCLNGLGVQIIFPETTIPFLPSTPFSPPAENLLGSTNNSLPAVQNNLIPATSPNSGLIKTPLVVPTQKSAP